MWEWQGDEFSLPEENTNGMEKCRPISSQVKRLRMLQFESEVLEISYCNEEIPKRKDPATAAVNQANEEEVDSRSVFVGNVDYSCTPEEVRQLFQSCGTVNRVTIRTNNFGQLKSYPYVEFVEPEAVHRRLFF